MDNRLLIDCIGYVGSILVLVSLLMSDIKKLRVLNGIGSAIFATYAVIIQSWPTAVMNIALVGINLYYLMKMKKEQN